MPGRAGVGRELSAPWGAGGLELSASTLEGGRLSWGSHLSALGGGQASPQGPEGQGER